MDTWDAPYTYHYLCQMRRLQTLTIRPSECLSQQHPSQQLEGPIVEKEGLWKKHFAQWRRRSLSWKRSRKTAHRRRGQKLAKLGQVESILTLSLSLQPAIFIPTVVRRLAYWGDVEGSKWDMKTCGCMRQRGGHGASYWAGNGDKWSALLYRSGSCNCALGFKMRVSSCHLLKRKRRKRRRMGIATLTARSQSFHCGCVWEWWEWWEWRQPMSTAVFLIISALLWCLFTCYYYLLYINT